MFDINALTEAPVNEAMSTNPLICPEGEWTAVVASPDEGGIAAWLREVDTKRGKQLIFQLPWSILDDAVKTQLKRDTVIVRQDIWLDVGPDGKTLLTSEGTNVDLGRIRLALGQQAMPGWNLSKLIGAGPAKIMVGHRTDRNDRSRKFAEVRRVAKIG